MIQLPYSDEAERALLGGLLIDPEALRGLNITAEDIYIERHRFIFETMQALAARHANVDYVTVSDALKTSGKLKEIGGAAFLTELVTDTPNSQHVDDYAAIIRDRARRRKVILETQKLTQAAFDLDANLDEAVAQAASRIVTGAGGSVQSRPISAAMSALYDDIEAASQNPRDIFGIPTGLQGFDKITRGLQRKEVFMLSGEPGVGKSFFGFQLACGAASGSNGIDGTPGAVFEMEMSEVATVRRALAAHSKIESYKMRSGKLTAEEWETLTSGVETMGELPIWISDYTGWTTVSLRAELARLKTHGIGWALIDYLPLLKDDGKDENETMARISSRVHDIAKDLDLSIIAIMDMSKAGIKGDTKGQAGLAGTRKLMYDADQIAFLRAKDETLVNLEWGKYREDSPSRVLPLCRVPGFPAYAEIHKP